MAHYAFLDSNNVVTEVIVGIDENKLIESKSPEVWYGEFRGQRCLRTSYNTRGNKNPHGTPFRKNYAGIGYTYREDLDGFIPPKPFPSWHLNEETGLWEPPIPYPGAGTDIYHWNEETQSWDLVQITIEG